MKIKNKLIILLSFVIFLLFTAFIVSRNFEKRTLVILFEKEAVEKERIFDKLILLKGKSLETLAFDYTYWDEMVTFIQTPDMEWAKSNLDTCLTTYDTNAVWVYKTDLSPVYSKNNLDDISLKEIPIIKEAITRKLFTNGNRFCHFFVETKEGLMEVRGATVHPSHDAQRNTPPQGYFFTGRIWNQKFIFELSELAKCKITIDSITGKNSLTGFTPLKMEISFRRILTDFNNVPLKEINITSSSDIINDFNNRSKKYFFALTLFIFIIIGVFSLLIIKWLGIPIHLISQVLETGEIRHIGHLENAQNEFGDIARLIKKFFKQKKELVDEINSRKEIEKNLKTSKQCFHNIVEKSQDGIVIVGQDMLVKFINPAAEFFLGNKYFLGKAFNFLILVKEITEIPIIRRNSEIGIGQMRAAETIWDSAGAYLITIQDISLQKEVQKNQRLAQLGKLAADMAHELNNPLMIISGNAQLSLLEQIDTQTIKNNLMVIYEQSLRGKDIIQRLLKFSQPSKNERKEEDINMLLTETILMLKHPFRLNNIDIKTNYMANLPLIFVDAHQMQEVFINLLTNAKDALAIGGIIEITTRLENNFIRIDFMDTGCGIPEKDLEKILEPFFTTKAHSNGLGLPLCFNIIKMHNGEIKITSKTAQGTTVTILLPMKTGKNNV